VCCGWTCTHAHTRALWLEEVEGVRALQRVVSVRIQMKCVMLPVLVIIGRVWVRGGLVCGRGVGKRTCGCTQCAHQVVYAEAAAAAAYSDVRTCASPFALGQGPVHARCALGVGKPSIAVCGGRESFSIQCQMQGEPCTEVCVRRVHACAQHPWHEMNGSACARPQNARLPSAILGILLPQQQAWQACHPRLLSASLSLPPAFLPTCSWSRSVPLNPLCGSGA